MRTLALLLCLLAAAAPAMAQEPPKAAPSPEANPLSDYHWFLYGGLKNVLLRSAEQMPEEHYTFKPTEDVRSFAQLLGHVADSQYLFCSIALNEANPRPNIEQTKTAKAELIAALKDAFAYCDQAYNNLTDAAAMEMVQRPTGARPRIYFLSLNQMHSALHYGNLITYMRLKNIVPPTSEPGFDPRPKR